MPTAPKGKRSLQVLYAAYQRLQERLQQEEEKRKRRLTAIQRHMLGDETPVEARTGGFKRMAGCRAGLDALDRYEGGKYKRSYHQMEFHDNFIRACARIFWKTEKPGTFARDHQKILELNGWESLSQEVLITTPRRFGKTFSVSMFAAAMLYSTAGLEMSIYATCKRISQKLLNNVYKFLKCIHAVTGTPCMPEIRRNCEEIVLKGDEGDTDIRVVNSYPSKV